MSTTPTPASSAGSSMDRHAGLRRALQRYYAAKDQLRRGLCLLAAGRHEEARRALEASLEANPQGLSLPAYLAAAYVGEGRFVEAAEHFDKLVHRAPAEALPRVRHALALWRAGQGDQAVAALRAGLHQNPESGELHFQLGVLLASRGEIDEAELRFTQAMALDKGHTESVVELALCHGARGNAASAVRWLRRAQAQDPHDARTALLLTYALRAAGGPAAGVVRVAMPNDTATGEPSAIGELASILETGPDFVEAFLSLDPEEVGTEVFAVLAATLNRALERSPEHADLHYHCGCVLSQLGRPREAIAALERAVDLRPNFVTALIQLAKLYRQGDRQADARCRLEQALALGAEYADVHYLLGNLYREDGAVERAREAYRRALRINPHYADARDALEAVSA